MARRKAPNTRVKLSLGLQNNYNVFQLVQGNNVLNNIGVTVITGGDQYVDDESSTVIHGGNSNWKDFDGVKSLSTNDKLQALQDIGIKCAEQLKKYLFMTVTGSDDKELYSSQTSYENYKNQFSVTFNNANTYEGNRITFATITSDENFTYYDYRQNICNAQGKDAIKGLKYSDINGDNDNHYLNMCVDILHYSKYYPIYKNVSMQVPCLQPVLYTKEDIDKYGLFVKNNIMYVSKLSLIAAWADDTSTKIHQRQYYILANSDNGNFEASATNWAENTFKVEYGQNWHDISQYKQGSYGTVHLTEFGEDIAKNYEEFYSTGFTIYGFKEEGDYSKVFLSAENNSKTATGTAPSAWLKQFNMYVDTYNLTSYGKINGNEADTLCALCFKGDAEDNVHLLNCWFPLKATGSDDQRAVTQQVDLRSTGPKKPDYVGMWIASVFCNIYRYIDSSDYNVNIVQDIIYLSDHYTTYTKDMIYYLTAPKTQSGDIDDGIIAFNPRGILSQPIQFGGENGYVALLKSRAGIDERHYDSSDKNVKVYIRDCIKNIPLQYRLRYIEPDTSTIGADSNIYILRTIDQPDRRMYSNGKLNKDGLYQLGKDSDGNTTVDYLGQNFKIRYLSKVYFDQDEVTLKGEYATDMPSDTMDMRNLWQMSENLILNRSKFLQPVSNYYALVHNGDPDGDLRYKDFDKREVLVPFAKFI